jgi:hypothetical protein
MNIIYFSKMLNDKYSKEFKFFQELKKSKNKHIMASEASKLIFILGENGLKEP